MIEPAASRATDPPPVTTAAGREPRVRPHAVLIGSELIYYEQVRVRVRVGAGVGVRVRFGLGLG